MVEVPEEPQPDSTAEPSRGKREPSNPKRGSGRNEAAGGKSPASPGLPAGPSAKRAVGVKASLSEEEGNSLGSTGLSGKAGNPRNDKGAQGDAPPDLKVRSGGRGMCMAQGWELLLFCR